LTLATEILIGTFAVRKYGELVASMISGFIPFGLPAFVLINALIVLADYF
jgi:sorbitol-specific phosphotransferase system component IIC